MNKFKLILKKISVILFFSLGMIFSLQAAQPSKKDQIAQIQKDFQSISQNAEHLQAALESFTTTDIAFISATIAQINAALSAKVHEQAAKYAAEQARTQTLADLQRELSELREWLEGAKIRIKTMGGVLDHRYDTIERELETKILDKKKEIYAFKKKRFESTPIGSLPNAPGGPIQTSGGADTQTASATGTASATYNLVTTFSKTEIEEMNQLISDLYRELIRLKQVYDLQTSLGINPHGKDEKAKQLQELQSSIRTKKDLKADLEEILLNIKVNNWCRRASAAQPLSANFSMLSLSTDSTPSVSAKIALAMAQVEEKLADLRKQKNELQDSLISAQSSDKKMSITEELKLITAQIAQQIIEKAFLLRMQEEESSLKTDSLITMREKI